MCAGKPLNSIIVTCGFIHDEAVGDICKESTIWLRILGNQLRGPLQLVYMATLQGNLWYRQRHHTLQVCAHVCHNQHNHRR